MLLPVFLLGVLLPGATLPGAAAASDAATCPFSLFQFQGRQDSVYGASATRSYYSSTASYNCCSGVLSSRSGLRRNFNTYGDAALRVSDQYRVTGPPAGTALTFTASLHVTGYMGGSQVQVLAWVAEGGTNAKMYADKVFSAFFDRMVDTTLRVVIHRKSGEWFDLASMVWTWDDAGWGELDAALSFSGLPPGAQITSCRGFGTTVDVETTRPLAPGVALAGPWPNPAHGAARVQVTLPGPAEARLTLHDLAGRVIERRALSGAGVHEITLALPPRPGLYLVRIEQNGRTASRAIVSR